MAQSTAAESDMGALPYMPLWVSDYLGDTMHLSCTEHGAYLLLIMAYWQRGEALPNDDAKLSRIVRMSPDEWAEIRPTVAEFFEVKKDRWIHNRINRQMGESETISARRKAAADKRWAERRQVPAEAKPKPTKPTKPTKPRGTRCPAGWNPDDALNAWAAQERPDLLLTKVIEEFRDYWASVPGAKGVKLDWDATFRNWIRRQVATGNRRNITTGAGNENSSGNSNGLGRNDKPSLPERNRRAAEHALKYDTF